MVNISKTETNNTKSTFDIITIDEYKAICEKIPTSSIERIDIVKCNDPSETMQSFYNRQKIKPDIIINGGLFNMSNGHNIMSFVDEGKEQNYKNNFVGFGIKKNNLTKIVKGVDNESNWKDFLTAHPVLVDNYKNTTKNNWGNAIDINYNATRQMIGYDEDNLYIITVDDKIKFDTAQDIANAINIQYVFNLDGGGSVKTMIFGKTVNKPTENRPLDNVICIYLKEKEIKLPATYSVEVNTTLNVRLTPNGDIIGVLYPQDEIIVYEINDGWAKFKYDIGNVEYAYCSTQYISYICEYVEEVVTNPENGLNYSILNNYKDKNDISDWAKDGVTYCLQNNLMNGDNDMLNPKEPLTREQFYTTLYRILNNKE